MKACVIFNPTARGEKAKHFRSKLAALAAEITLKPTTCAGSARALAAEAIREGFDTLIAAGGDGTLNEVLNGMAEEPNGLALARLAVMPLGTANVFAREIGVPLNLEAAWDVVRGGRERTIDLPFAEWNRGGTTTRRYFAQLAGAGLDARAVELVNWPMKKRFGYGAYVIAAIRAFLGHRTLISVSTGDRVITGEQVLIGNGKLYGGSFSLFPSADLQDGQLEILVYPRISFTTLIRSIRGALTGDFHGGSDTVQLRASRVEIHAASPAPFELDGELIGHLPVTFGIRSRALRVAVP